ncbi:MAG: ribonuclease HI family protein [Candidatus Pacebacteria bacterium]|nr:ribonuclease HI family protein [Candidatus Paceibacterota bacterium]
MNIKIFTDGGSRGNPGISGAGAVIFDEQNNEMRTTSKFLGKKTNNWAEYEAVIIGLELAYKVFGDKTKETNFEIKMDSQLVQRQLKGEYRVKEESLKEQFLRIHNLIVKYFPNIKFTHIPREENKRADELANEAMDDN